MGGLWFFLIKKKHDVTEMFDCDFPSSLQARTPEQILIFPRGLSDFCSEASNGISFPRNNPRYNLAEYLQ